MVEAPIVDEVLLCRHLQEASFKRCKGRLPVLRRKEPWGHRNGNYLDAFSKLALSHEVHEGTNLTVDLFLACTGISSVTTIKSVTKIIQVDVKKNGTVRPHIK
jgi:hypothetical protein